MQKITRTKKIGESGCLVGESHGKAKFTDHEIELMRQLHEGGMDSSDIALRFECSHSYVWKVVNYKIRATPAVRIEVKTISIP